ncbi:hypothetical protein [Rhodoblastus sp.]|uniref:hypothetical protein n=1 Tax=Rhodoblastus sp. TaxID=1962975 RepID=UPI003F9B2925
MDDDTIYAALPDDPEEAFLILETTFAEECNGRIALEEDRLGTDANLNPIYVQYISKVLGAIEALGLQSRFSTQSIPSVIDAGYNTYIDFVRDVEFYKTTLKIRTARRRREYSVSFDVNTKKKLLQMLARMKDIVSTLDVSDAKKEALFAKIAALESEIHCDRTRLDVIGAFWLELCSKVGEGVEKLEPLRKWVDSIGGLIADAKAQERGGVQQPSLPSPPKRLEPPKAAPETNEDGVPF